MIMDGLDTLAQAGFLDPQFSYNFDIFKSLLSGDNTSETRSSGVPAAASQDRDTPVSEGGGDDPLNLPAAATLLSFFCTDANIPDLEPIPELQFLSFQVRTTGAASVCADLRTSPGVN